MEDNRHVFVEIRQIVDWLSIELFFIEEEERKEAFYVLDWRIIHERDIFVPFLEDFTSFGVGKIAQVYEVGGCDGEG